MKINANVTFVIWILEWISNILIYICWILGPNFARYFPEVVLICYCIILPHTFLMNTSHNKDLIIDDGLKTTIINAFGLPFKLQSGKDSVEQITPEKDNKEKNDVKVDETNAGKIDDKENIQVNEQEGKIYTISKDVLHHIPKHNINICLPNVIMEIPSTSMGKMESSENSCHALQQSLSDSDTEEETTDFKDPRLTLGMDIITYMMSIILFSLYIITKN